MIIDEIESTASPRAEPQQESTGVVHASSALPEAMSRSIPTHTALPCPPRHDALVESLAHCFVRYSARITGPVVVGLSGGKDSFSLLFLLSALGVEVFPTVVDLGYSSFKAGEIASVARNYGFDVTILTARQSEALVHLKPRVRSSVESDLVHLSSPDNCTPCTACSRTKRALLLAEARRRKANWIMLGHHREDLGATILKDYFAFRYYEVVGSYEREAFTAFVRQDDVDLDFLRDLVQRGLAATMGIRVRLDEQVHLFRPMAFIPELELEEYVRAISLSTFGSGCSHEAMQGRQSSTKREIVHYDLRERLRNAPDLGRKLLAVALDSLDSKGCTLFNPRAYRDRTLPEFDRSDIQCAAKLRE
jgi:tRNA(Ile)-lysidine synthase TilS/MesJ